MKRKIIVKDDLFEKGRNYSINEIVDMLNSRYITHCKSCRKKLSKEEKIYCNECLELQELKKSQSTKDKIQAQVDYCNKNKIPMFAPAGNGSCYSCSNNVYEFYTIEECKTKHITSCSHCNKSFVS